MKRLVLAVFVFAAIALAFVAGRTSAPPRAQQATFSPAEPGAEGKLYQCSMHPQIVSREPGQCPICQMELEQVEETPHEQSRRAGAGQERRILFYRNPMNADVTSLTPMKDEMGMDYIPVYSDEGAQQGGDVPGHAAFTLTAERQQLIGVTRAKAATKDLTKVIRTAGKVAYDPDLYRAIVEYRQAARGGSPEIARAATLRLRQMGVSEDLIKVMSAPDHDPENLLLPGKEAWVYAQIYEYELDLVRTGQEVTVTAPSLTAHTYAARVVAVDSVLDSKTRTARARILVPTPERNLRPETFVHVDIEVPLGRKLAIPAEAVLDTGERQFVFVVSGPGTFEPRTVVLGPRAGGDFEVVSGVAEGEEVVASANFLIDSESRVPAPRAAFTKSSPEAQANRGAE
jgi:Cu(I)/Ag(I) efflux system membrane fusion protein